MKPATPGRWRPSRGPPGGEPRERRKERDYSLTASARVLRCWAVGTAALARDLLQSGRPRLPRPGSCIWSPETATTGGREVLTGETAIRNKVFVGNLSFDVTRDELIQAFSAAGKVVDAKVPTDRETGRPRGFAFAEFEDDDAAQKSISLMNGKDLKGRPLRVNEAENRPPRPRAWAAVRAAAADTGPAGGGGYRPGAEAGLRLCRTTGDFWILPSSAAGPSRRRAAGGTSAGASAVSMGRRPPSTHAATLRRRGRVPRRRGTGPLTSWSREDGRRTRSGRCGV